MLTRAYWITPDGQILDVGDRKHINLIVDNPQQFGESAEAINTLYNENREPMGVEGKAREIIMRRVITRGFVRIRQQRNQWMIQLRELTPTTESHLCQWATSQVGKGDQFANIVIDQLGVSRNRRIKATLDSLVRKRRAR